MSHLLQILIPIFLLSCTGNPNPMSVETKTAKSGNKTLFIYANDTQLEFTMSRPDVRNDDHLLCVAAAFTDLESYTVDGLCVVNGRPVNRKINYTLAGAARLGLTGFMIIKTNNGQKCENVLLSLDANPDQSYFQQVLLVSDGALIPHSSTDLWQRRAIVIMDDGRIAIAESERRRTYNNFSKDLISCGVKDALYLDMGAWDEGWYKEPGTGKVKALGRAHSATNKQCNWLVFKR
jgi:hypothetical protein